MSASSAKVGYGTTLSVASTSMTELIEIAGPGQSASMIDVTHMASDNNYREFIKGLLDGGEVTFKLNFIKSVFSALATAFEGSTAASCTLTLSNSLGAFAFSAWVQNLSVNPPLDGQVTLDCTLKITGKPTFS